MAVTTNATLLVRRGLEEDFKPEKMRQGEWALSIDNKYIRMCVAPGICVRIATYDAFERDMEIIQGILEDCETIKSAIEQIQEVVSGKADQVEVWAENAGLFATLAESWAVGGTGSRADENTNNARYYSELSKEYMEEAKKTDVGELEKTIEGYEQSGFLSRNLNKGIAHKNISSDGNTYNENDLYLSTIEPLNVKPNNTITISSDAITNSSAKVGVYVGKWNGSQWIERIRLGELENGKISYDIPSNTTKIYVFLLGDGNTKADGTYIQIEYGTEAHRYTPYALSNSVLTQDLAQYVDEGYLPKNKFDKNKIVKGYGFYWDTTRLINANAETGYEYIEVKPNTTYTISGQKNWSASWRNTCFDANKNFIAHINGKNTEGGTTYTTPSNAKYIGVTVNITDAIGELNSLQVEEGSSATPYTPFALSNVEITQDLTQFEADGYLGKQLFKEENILVGKSWDLTDNTARALWNADVEPNKTYEIHMTNRSAYTSITVVCKTSASATTYISGTDQYPTSDTFTVTTPSNCNCICVQFRKDGTTMTKENVLSSQMSSETVPSNISLKLSLTQLSTVQSGAVTNLSPIASTYRMRLKKCGNIVSLNFYFGLNAISDNLTQWVDMFQLPSGFFNTDNHLDFIMNDFDKNSYQAMISNTGLVRFVPRASITQGKLCVINLTYILG